MVRFLLDTLRYPRDRSPDNRFAQVMRFCFIDYPVYFWIKPSVWRVLLFPFLLWEVMRGKR